MDSLFAAEDLRRAIYGAKLITREVREVGVGGPSALDDYETNMLFKDELDRKTIGDRIDKLLRQSDLQLFSMNTFDTFFRKKKDSLECLPTIQPAEGAFLSGFGMRLHPIFKIRRMHNGIDIKNYVGTPVIASASGTVKTGENGTFGKYVLLNHLNGFITAYAHLDTVIVKGQQTVRRGQIIGYLGNSGRSTGPHLHYEVRSNRAPINPLPYILPENFIVD
ncbi:MAG: M23 family metallopeptidase [Fibrobacterota bacterium]